jgi:hypothetical protein
VAEDEIVSLRSVLTEVFLELRRRFRLDVTDLGAEAVADSLEPGVRPAIPRSVGYRSRREQRDAEAGRIRGGAIVTAPATGDDEGEEDGVDDCAKTTCATMGLLHNALRWK